MERSVSAKEAHQFALNANTIGAVKPRFIGRICSLQRNRVTPTPQSLECRLLIVHESNQDFAGICDIGFLNDDGVAVENARVDHGVTCDLKRVMLTAPNHPAGDGNLADL